MAISVVPLQGLAKDTLVYEAMRIVSERAVGDDFKLATVAPLLVTGTDPGGSRVQNLVGGTLVYRGGQVQVGLEIPLKTIYGGTGSAGPWTPGSVIFVGSTGNFKENNADFFYSEAGSRLEIEGDAAGGLGIRVQNRRVDAAALSQVEIVNDAGTAGLRLSMGSSAGTKEAQIHSFGTSPSLHLGASATNYLTIFGINGNIGIRQPVPDATLHVLSPSGTTNVYFDAYNGSGSASFLTLRTARAGPGAILNGDWIGGLSFRGYHNSGAFHTSSGAQFIAVAGENFTASAQGTALVLTTTPTGSTTAVGRLTIAPTGYVAIGQGTGYSSSALSVQSAGAAAVPALSVAGTTPALPSAFQWSPVTNERVAIFTGATGSGSYATLAIGTNQAEAAGNAVGALSFAQTQSGKSNPDGYSGLKAGLACETEGSGGSTAGYGGILRFWTRADNGAAIDAFRVTSAQRVGFGTTNPFAGQVHVNKSATGALGGDLWITNSGTNAVGSTARLAFGPDATTDTVANIGLEAIVTNVGSFTADLVFKFYDGSGYNEKMRATSGGNLYLPGMFAPSSAVAAQYSPYISLRVAAKSQIEFGHSNTAGYGSTIGAEDTSGRPYLAFNGGKGTNADTYRTFGIRAAIVRSDNAGGVAIGSVSTASADNQAFLPRIALPASPSGVYQGHVDIRDNAAIAADIGGKIVLGGNYTGTTQTIWASILGGKKNATDGNYAGQLLFSTRENGGTDLAVRTVIDDIGRTHLRSTDRGGAVFNVMHRDFGAIGNDSADDTAAINAAITAAEAGATPGIVYFPAGYTFKTKGNHTITTCSVIGGGSGATVINLTEISGGDGGATNDLFVISASASRSNIHIGGFRVKSTVTRTAGWVVKYAPTYNSGYILNYARIFDITMLNQFNGIWLTRYEYCWITDCLYRTPSVTGTTGAIGFKIGQTASTDVNQGSEIYITGCHTNNGSGSANALSYGFWFEDCDAVYMQHCGAIASLNGIKVTNTAHACVNYFWNCVVSDTTSNSAATNHSTHITGTLPNKRFHITNSWFCSAGRGGGAAAAADGLHIDNGDLTHSLISNSSFLNNGHDGLWAEGAAYVEITNCNFGVSSGNANYGAYFKDSIVLMSNSVFDANGGNVGWYVDAAAAGNLHGHFVGNRSTNAGTGWQTVANAARVGFLGNFYVNAPTYGVAPALNVNNVTY